MTRYPLGAVSAAWATAVMGSVAFAQELPDYARAHRFEDFPVAAEAIAAPARPNVSSGEAHRFRTELRRAAREPANFAGHLRVATWGCGTCCQQFGIIDLKSGQVYMPSFLVGCGCPMDKPPCDEAGIYFRKNSALLVLIGIAQDEWTCGVYYYLWRKGTLEYLGAEGEIKSECGA